MKKFELVKELLTEEAPTREPHDDLVGSGRSR